jgi:glutathione-specific gamma-glutamylcyclotransferase
MILSNVSDQAGQRKPLNLTSLRRAVLLAVRAMSAMTLSEAELSNGDLKEGDLWVFGYGSLMWRPGFEFIEQVQARLIGEHRALCVYSFDHRGTPEKPGLVLGLDRGGACRGVAFRVAARLREDTVNYLRSREQTTNVYREVMRSVWLENESRRRVSALAYVVDRGHVQYAGRLSLAEQLRYVKQGHGRSGINRDYVLATVNSIEKQGFRDPQLHQLAMMLHDARTLPPPRAGEAEEA